jgi:hypothetical protein
VKFCPRFDQSPLRARQIAGDQLDWIQAEDTDLA